MGSKSGTAGKRGDAAAIFAAGSCSGMITSSVLQPLDVIKTHLMAEHHAGRTGNRWRNTLASWRHSQDWKAWLAHVGVSS